MRLSIRVPDHAVRTAATLTIGIAVLLLGGWWAGQARAAHNPGSTVHACAAPNGTLRLAEECRSSESPLVLATEAGLQAAESRIAALEADNADVAALEGRVEELEATVSEQATTISGLQGDVGTLESANTALQDRVGTLEGLLAGVTRSEVDGRDTLRFTGMNLQIVNGQNSTATSNGLGNLIIGYNGQRSSPAATREGSHYLVVGDEHEWTRFGGILAGLHNTASGVWASVTGGVSNTASGDLASVTGGFRNTASGMDASVSGGYRNNATGPGSSVSGGAGNTASGARASVSGGVSNDARGTDTSILGGHEKMVSTQYACHPACP